MTFYEVLEQVLALLQQQGRVSYRALKRHFALDDDYIEDLKAEIIQARRLAVDEQGVVLVWSGGAAGSPDLPAPGSQPIPLALQEAHLLHGNVPATASHLPEAERRQLTVLFCDLVGSTTLAHQLDLEDWREVMQAYQATCAKVIARYEGHIAQYLGDGLLVYFGYPRAHEDDAQRAVRAGLGIVEALGPLNTRLAQECGVQLAVRLGIHTGLVVMGEVGDGTRQEQLAVGETPNLAAHLQGIAAPNTLVISAATVRLLGGFFACQSLGPQLLQGRAQPLEVYQVLAENMARSRLEAAGSTGLTPLVGREQEVGLLLERWAQVKDGLGQVVLLSGEAGIGKSRLVQVLTEHVAAEPLAWLTPCQCSPYHQNTALYPMIDLLERVVLRYEREESPQQKLSKLEGFLVQYGLLLAEAIPLFVTLLSLPLPADYTPLAMSPEQQKQQTLQALLTILLRIAAQQPVLFVMEDLHWVDPSTLELLSLIVDQGPTARILALLTFRPDFSPPWTGRSHLTQMMLHRLTRPQAVAMIHRVAHHKPLPSEVLDQVVAKTDGVPLFMEELTKMVLESDLLEEGEEHYELTGPLPPLAIPATLHDSLMARLDRLATVKSLAQLGATLGREFSYALLQAISPWDEATLGRGLQQLVAAEFLYQRGLPPQATYVFKHALIQEAAYQSLLKSMRQQHHQRIAQVLETQFPEVVETQPELVAHHYTEAGLSAPAVPYWQQAGQRAIERSANREAVAHLRKGLEGLAALPDTPERAQQELVVQTTLGVALVATQGFAAPEVQRVYARAQTLCQQVGDTPHLVLALWGLWLFYVVRAEFQTAYTLGEQLCTAALRLDDTAALVAGHFTLGVTLWHLGQFVPARTYLEQALAGYDPARHPALLVRYGQDIGGVACPCFTALTLWFLGCPDRALASLHAALAWAQELSHPFSQAFALFFAIWLYQFRREEREVCERVEALLALSTAQGFQQWLAMGPILQGWALAIQGQAEAGRGRLQQGLAAFRQGGAQMLLSYFLGLLAEVQGRAGDPEAGLHMVDEALTEVDKRGEGFYAAELYRLKGELLLQPCVRSLAAAVSTLNARHQTLDAEACFQQALDIARRQQAKSLELRAATSLSRLWQRQGKHAEACELLAPVYGWFTEGFDTADLREAKALLEELGG
jgi:TOMM system kinase/cyclase fusion protein